MLITHGERVWIAARASTLSHFAIIGLPRHADTADDIDLAPLWDELAARTVVILPEAIDTGADRAADHAAAIADHGAAAIGIVIPREDGPPEINDAIDDALRDAKALALPSLDRFGKKHMRAVAPRIDPVDGEDMFARLRAVLARTLAEPQTTIDTLALWCLHAWMHDAFDVSPRLVLHATDPRADHARALRLLAWLTPSPLVVARTIASHLLPIIAAERPTLLLDDAGGAMLTYLDMRALIAAGALRDGAFLGARTRANPSGWSSCFAPTAIATAAGLSDDVRRRSIVMPMSPPKPGARADSVRLTEPPDDVPPLRAAMQRWAKDAGGDLPSFESVMPPKLARDTRENWYPLLAIAHHVGLDIGLAAGTAAQTLADTTRPLSSNLELLADIRDLVGAVEPDTRIPSLELLEKLTTDPERAWATAHRGRKLTARGLAERLNRFAVRPRVLRLPDDTIIRGYQSDELIEAFARYLGE